MLGWDGASFTVDKRKPWTYHLGAKLVLPLQYLERCGYPDDALVVFTDHDVVFQGGYAALQAAYAKVVAQAGGDARSPLVFSAESDSYPLELKGLYPANPTDHTNGAHHHLNSGMWMGHVGDAKKLLEAMTGVSRGVPIATLLRHYHFWGQLSTRTDPIPAAYTENDQTKYAGIYVAQEMAAACAAGPGRSYAGRGRGCFTFLHDGGRRCAPGCGHAARQHPLTARMALDRANSLFENVFHAGRHQRTADGRLHRGQQLPVVLHYNGPAKVVFEREWQLNGVWDAQSGKTPVLLHVEGLRAGQPAAARAAATAAFESNVTFIDPWLHRAPSIGPLRFTCDVPP